MTNKKTDIKCPTCGKEGTWTTDNTFRPFCSERCKLIDLGDWAAEKHRVAGDPVDKNKIPDENEED